jgi:hypothetical protein
MKLGLILDRPPFGSASSMSNSLTNAGLSIERPRQVAVHHEVSVLKIDPFTSGICSDEDPDFGVIARPSGVRHGGHHHE